MLMKIGGMVVRMCGRYVIETEEENIEIKEILNELNRKFSNSEVMSTLKTGEIFPTNNVPVITSESGERVAHILKWGFPNYMQKNGVIINARSETIIEKPTFKRLIDSKRCLIPASGFYEWKLVGDKKVKHVIRASGGDFFYMAGLYNNFTDKEGKPYTGFVIITTEANDQMRGIHNRMPVILRKGESSIWLNAEFEEASKIFLQSSTLLDISVA
jgi:putative SOS response-associated peptidase YedK